MDSFYIWHKWSLSLEGVSRVTFYSESGNLNFWQIFEIFSALTLKKKSTVLDRFFPYLSQMIISMRGCVAYNDLWPWPISSRSFCLGLENRVCSVACTVPDRFFPYLAQMITSMRRCVACDDLWPWPISSRLFDLDFENRVRSVTFFTFGPTGAKRPLAGCPECICNRPRPWRRPCVSDWGCGAVILLSRGEFGCDKNKICYQRGCVWTYCYVPNL